MPVITVVRSPRRVAAAALGWRRPILVPICALVASFLFVLLVGLSTATEPPGSPTGPEAATPTDPALPPTSTDPAPTTVPSPEGGPAAFAAAPDGKPTIVVMSTEQSPSNLRWQVFQRPAGRSSYEPVRGPGEIVVGTPRQVQEALVDRLVCVTVEDAGWMVAQPVTVPNLAIHVASDPQQRQKACQGGYSDALAVPARIEFTVAKVGP